GSPSPLLEWSPECRLRSCSYSFPAYAAPASASSCASSPASRSYSPGCGSGERSSIVYQPLTWSPYT
ncbi:MAG: hypothetical protein QOF37_1255, partial [Thermoleophilaceae bacterium]|nr:hypothetical protein [Thermoleophilaceae bacterium]